MPYLGCQDAVGDHAKILASTKVNEVVWDPM